jgi:hypothetical protein
VRIERSALQLEWTRSCKRELNEAVIFSAEGATGLKPGVERSGAPGTDLKADERCRRERIMPCKG